MPVDLGHELALRGGSERRQIGRRGGGRRVHLDLALALVDGDVFYDPRSTAACQ